MESLKIVQIIQKPQFRGAELFAYQLSNHLIAQGHEVLLVCLYEGDVELPFKGPIINLQRPENKRFFDFFGWKKFSNIIDKYHPDIIQANAADTLKFAASSKFFYKIPIPIVFRNANKIGDFMRFPLKKIINSFYLSQVSMVLSVSKLCRKDFLKTFNISKGKVKTIEIGVERNNSQECNLDFSIFENKKVLVHVGSFVAEKNHLGLIRIFSQVLISHPNAVLLLIGKGILVENVREKVLEYKISKNVFFLDYREDVIQIFKKSHCLVLPSLIEGLPGVILEAMYSKLPIVSYDVGGISEIINRDTGSLVKKNNEEEFVNQVNRILNERDNEKIHNAFELVKRKYNNERIAQRFSKAYYKLILSKKAEKQVKIGMQGYV
ncbi:glycosyltransferase family 4 protein [Antarcticibacterium arcticum]|uniref:Glycosyltransferase family 4 protein n=1 Tax=Antarcticibacterium arcticum TaxID=2585771 RepID=A0A5B8YJG9_9FLAO|nr:glycosyltransferase family 4 protein [Antarcticibacterium arcticum]QED36526.1 glycosyltransferase family 4 protein [Antarcticibacterium arcticum]